MGRGRRRSMGLFLAVGALAVGLAAAADAPSGPSSRRRAHDTGQKRAEGRQQLPGDEIGKSKRGTGEKPGEKPGPSTTSTAPTAPTTPELAALLEALGAQDEGGGSEGGGDDKAYVRIMPSPVTVQLRDNTRVRGFLLLRDERGMILIEDPGSAADPGADPDAVDSGDGTGPAKPLERLISARDIRAVLTDAEAGAGAARPDAAAKDGGFDRWPGFVLRHDPPAGGATVESVAADPARDVTTEEVIVFPRYEARLEKGRYVILRRAVPEGDGPGWDEDADNAGNIVEEAGDAAAPSR